MLIKKSIVTTEELKIISMLKGVQLCSGAYEFKKLHFKK